MAAAGKHILGIDLSHDRTQAIVAVGDVDRADNVAVFTPGFTTKVANMSAYVAHMAQLNDRADKFEQINTAPGQKPKTTASVVWLDYQAPQWSTTGGGNSVGSTHTAKEAGTHLADFYRGINASRVKEPHLTALGHSYGSTTVGAALEENTGVDDMAIFGSPGLPVHYDTQLQLDTGGCV